MLSASKRASWIGLLVATIAPGMSVDMGAQNLEKFVISRDAARRAKTRDEISLDTARRIADACLQQAAERKMGTSIVILSPTGNTVYAVRADGQTPVQIETARMKAQTALFMRDSTHAWQNRTMDPGAAIRLLPLDQFWASGGLPIVVDDVLIGAIGVGGMGPTAEWSDEICAHNAMTAVLGPQPPLAPFLPPAAGR
jgi:glc operon protein GlcG